MVDLTRKQQRDHHQLLIGGAEVERVDTLGFLGVTISRDQSWINHNYVEVKKVSLPPQML